MTRREMAAVVSRYTQWDGTQRLKLDADKVFEKLAEYLSYTDDVRQAMDWMMRQGMDFDGVKVMGLEEFIEQLRQEMRQRYRDFNLKNALSEMEQKLEDILNRERAKLESGWAYVSDLVGRVVLDGDREIGRVQDIQFGAGEAPLLIVQLGSKVYEVPYAEAYLVSTDLEHKKICMKLPEGLLEVNAPLTAEEKEEQRNSSKKMSS